MKTEVLERDQMLYTYLVMDSQIPNNEETLMMKNVFLLEDDNVEMPELPKRWRGVSDSIADYLVTGQQFFETSSEM